MRRRLARGWATVAPARTQPSARGRPGPSEGPASTPGNRARLAHAAGPGLNASGQLEPRGLRVGATAPPTGLVAAVSAPAPGPPPQAGVGPRPRDTSLNGARTRSGWHGGQVPVPIGAAASTSLLLAIIILLRPHLCPFALPLLFGSNYEWWLLVLQTPFIPHKPTAKSRYHMLHEKERTDMTKVRFAWVHDNCVGSNGWRERSISGILHFIFREDQMQLKKKVVIGVSQCAEMRQHIRQNKVTEQGSRKDSPLNIFLVRCT
jgi:hypothetical protein